MKKMMSIVVAVLVISAMMVSVCAEAVPSPTASPVPSPVVTDAVIHVDGKDVEVSPDAIIVVPMEGEDEIPEEARAELEAAQEALTAAASLGDLIPEMAGKDVASVFYVGTSDKDVEDALANGGSITITMEMDVEENAQLSVIRFADGTWSASEKDTAAVEDGNVVVTLYELGVIGLVVG